MQPNKGYKPSIFVSSTCYDLKQVRVDLKNFLTEQLGYDAVLSEFDSFPIDPDKNTIDNCLSVVSQRADIFVLVVGNRYGHETDSGHSITNAEFLLAKSKGIPVYVFILKNVLNAIDIWRTNKSADFSSLVTSSKVFEFIDLIFKEYQGWIYEFETANDIINTLKNQFAYLFNNSLQTQILFSRVPLSKRLQQLDGKSLKIVIEKPRLWEYLLFGSALQNGLENAVHYRDDYNYNLYIGHCKIIEDPSELLDWLRRKLKELSRLAGCYGTLFNISLQTALGPNGVEGDAEQIVYVADRAVRIYKSLIDWSLEFDSILLEEDDHQDEWTYLRNLSRPVLLEIERYAERYNKTIADTLALLQTRTEDSGPLTIDLSWGFAGIDSEAINQVVRKLVGMD